MPAKYADASDETRLRLASARRKVRSFLAQIASLETSDHPHGEVREALEFVRSVFVARDERLGHLTIDSKKIDQECETVREECFRYATVLGLIVRSSNVRNLFEVYYPLRSLVNKITPGSVLVLSSEWDWHPLAPPLDTIPVMGGEGKFIFVGSPAIEAENVLLVPLAGRAIAHSAWDHHRVELALQTDLREKIKESAQHVVTQDCRHMDPLVLADDCYASAIAQLKEVFCDLVGLCIFSESFLFAYDHVLAPGGGARDELCPDSLGRVNFLRHASKTWKIPCASSLFARWRPSTRGSLSKTIQIADRVVGDAAYNLTEIVERILHESGVDRADQDRVKQIERAFDARVPYGEHAQLSEILCAGWRVLRRNGRFDRATEHSISEGLNTIILKSVEVSEFIQRVRKC